MILNLTPSQRASLVSLLAVTYPTHDRRELVDKVDRVLVAVDMIARELEPVIAVLPKLLEVAAETLAGPSGPSAVPDGPAPIWMGSVDLERVIVRADASGLLFVEVLTPGGSRSAVLFSGPLFRSAVAQALTELGGLRIVVDAVLASTDDELPGRVARAVAVWRRSCDPRLPE